MENPNNQQTAEIIQLNDLAAKNGNKSTHAAYIFFKHVAPDTMESDEQLIHRAIMNLINTYGQDNVNYVMDMVNFDLNHNQAG